MSVYEERLAVTGALSLAIGEFDSINSLARNGLIDDSYWSELYREELHRVCEEIIDLAFEVEDFRELQERAMEIGHRHGLSLAQKAMEEKKGGE